MSKVWIVFEGDYSDRSVIWVCSSEEKLNEFCNGNSEQMDIEEWDLDKDDEHRMVRCYWMRLDLVTGEVLGSNNKGTLRMVKPSHAAAIEMSGGYTFTFSDRVVNPAVSVSSQVSYDHAVKVAAEERQKWLRDEPVRAEAAALALKEWEAKKAAEAEERRRVMADKAFIEQYQRYPIQIDTHMGGEPGDV